MIEIAVLLCLMNVLLLWRLARQRRAVIELRDMLVDLARDHVGLVAHHNDLVGSHNALVRRHLAGQTPDQQDRWYLNGEPPPWEMPL